MKKSEIKFTIELDKDQVPDKIFWEADESPTGKKEEAGSINLSIWDAKEKSTLRIDLWGKEMPTIEMKKFFIDTIGGMADSILRSTGDQKMYDQMNALCMNLANDLAKEAELQAQ